MGGKRDTVRIYFAGLNSAKFAAVLEGEDVLISYADIVRRPGVWERDIRPRLERGAYRSVILDSGAFTELTERKRGKSFHVDLEAYGRFCLEFGDLFDEIVTLDDIEGDVARTRRNTDHLEGLGLVVVPVFHQGEPWSVLEDYVRRYERLGLGVQRTSSGSPAAGAFDWTRDALERIPSSVSVHGFGMTRYAKRLPRMATTDSTTWIAEFRAVRKTDDGTHYCRHRLIRELDDWGRLALVVRSYGEPQRSVVVDVPDAVAKGQGRTVLRRFSPASLRRTCASLADPARRAA